MYEDERLNCVFLNSFLYSFALLGLRCCMDFSAAVQSGDNSLVAMLEGFSWLWLLFLPSTGSGPQVQ